MIRTLALLLFLVAAQDKRKIPPPGVPVPEADRTELESGLKELSKESDPDVRIYQKAVDWALRYDEILNPKEIATAKALLKEGVARARQLREGKPAWRTATGLVVRAYVSKIDGSVQPFGLVIPPTYRPGTKTRLDFWLHGRSETLTELAFVSGREKSTGDFTPADTIVCHLYGRFCNASKFAGEMDLFETLDQLRKEYTIDEDRISVRGFSMGGASTWHLGAHHAGLWACVAPGAGFAETPVYANVARDPVKPTEWEEKLWHWYNATDYAANLFNTSVVAYSGELDKQKAAADTMAKAMKEEGMDLVHVIGPKVEHKYEPEAKKEVARLVDERAIRGRDPSPRKVRLTTWTLQYNQMRWVTADALERHWERARVDAELEAGIVKAVTQNVSAVSFAQPGKTILDGQEFPAGGRFHKVSGKWVSGPLEEGLRKRHGLQGPIDDAFMDSFLFVTPSGKSTHVKLDSWVSAEEPRAEEFWRRIMRGEARRVKDEAVTDAEIASSNLVLWGDPSSNKVLGKIADRLPIRWDAKEIRVGSQTFPADHHVPVLIYPNPLNPKRYVVLNTGFTWQENAHLSNARHVPILPDWAIVDTDKPNTLHMSERVAAAGFFDEEWKLR
ncbi:MAG TPA: prolyl oligopeptidase family serine peptidase [Planctomycetota bacterium]|nr:prolyl oligopeptidase family serine peptidase [Planctomycetota bacterium]